MTKKVDLNGYWLIEDNPVSKEGVFPYLGSQISSELEPNKIYMVYRPAEELENPETVESFNVVPFTDEHEMIGEGFTKYDDRPAGGVLYNVKADHGKLVGNLKIYSEKLKDEIANGKKELSLGYLCDYELSRGVWNGQRYDAIQKNIRGNHVALVNKGRMGADVRVYDKAITMDSMPVDLEKGFTMANDKDDDIEWITVKGTHIPIKKGQTAKEAIEERFGNGTEGYLAKKDYEQAQKLHEYTERKKEERKINFSEGDEVKTEEGVGKIVEKRKMKFSDTPTYKIKLNNGKTIWRYEEELKKEELKKEESESKKESSKEKNVKETNISGENGSGTIVRLNNLYFVGYHTKTGERGIKHFDSESKAKEFLNEKAGKSKGSSEGKKDIKGKEVFVRFARKPSDIDEVKSLPQGEGRSWAKISEVIDLDEKQYNKLTKRPLDDYDFLKGKGGYDDDGNRSVVAVTSKGKPTLLIDPSGSSYARYMAIMEDKKSTKDKGIPSGDGSPNESGANGSLIDKGVNKMADKKAMDADKREAIREVMAIANKPDSSFEGGEEEKIDTIAKLLEKSEYSKSETGTANDEDIDDEKKDVKDKCGKDEDEEEKKDDKKDKPSEDEDDEEKKKKEEEKKASEDAMPRQILKMIAKRDAIVKQVEPIIGSFACDEMTDVDAAVYACKKLGLQVSQDEALPCLRGFLAAHKGNKGNNKVYGLDSAISAENGVDKATQRYLKGE